MNIKNLNNLFTKISLDDQINFAKNLAVLLGGGVTINEAMDSLADQAKPGVMKNILHRIKGHLEKGVSLNSALKEEGDVFSNIFISLVKAGEMSGNLSNNLDFLAVWLDRDNSLRKQINSILIYPKIVLSAVVLLGGGLAIFILPNLEPLFASLNVQLPFITRAVLSASMFIKEHWPYILVGGLFIWLTIFLLFKIKTVKYHYDKILVFTPYVKDFIVGYQLALFAQLMGTLLKSGISIDEALEISYVGTTNLYYKKVLKEIIDRINKGVSLVGTMKLYAELYPVNSMSVLAVGENSGTLEESFFKVSDFWTREIVEKTKTLPTIIEPILLVFIAITVGLIAMSVIMPIYKLTGSLGV